jgi:hypothetical protein
MKIFPIDMKRYTAQYIVKWDHNKELLPKTTQKSINVYIVQHTKHNET